MRKPAVRSILCTLLACLLLCGCQPLLERSYASVTPHVPFSDEDLDPSILRAETYQGLVSALLHLVSLGDQEGVIRLYQYVSVTGSASGDIDRACLEVTQEDPLGVWAVDYIKYSVEQTTAYYEVSVKLAYTKTPQELAQVISVTGTTAIPQELADLLPELPDQAVFRISYFGAEDSAETIHQAVLSAYQTQSQSLPPLESVTVNLYPQEGSQRLAEILLTWGSPVPVQAIAQGEEIF